MKDKLSVNCTSNVSRYLACPNCGKQIMAKNMRLPTELDVTRCPDCKAVLEIMKLLDIYISVIEIDEEGIDF